MPLGKVEVRFLRLARQQYVDAVQRAEDAWQAAVALVAAERGIPDGTPVQLVEQEDGTVHLAVADGGDINPSQAPDPGDAV